MNPLSLFIFFYLKLFYENFHNYSSFFRNNCNLYACLIVLYHEFLSSVILNENSKDKLFNSFYETCFEKIANIFNLLIIMQCVNFNDVSYITTFMYCLFYYVLIAFDSLIAILSVQNYFESLSKM